MELILQSELVEALKTGYVKIDYTKKDGSTRMIDCTLLEAEAVPPVVAAPIADKKGYVTIWDRQSRSWKQLIVSSINAVHIKGRAAVGITTR